MDEHTLKLLEYERLLDLIAEHAHSEPGADYCRSLRPDKDFVRAEENWRLVDEAKFLLQVEGPLPLEDLVDLRVLLDRLKMQGLVLRPLELLAILGVVRTSRLVKGFIRAEQAPGLFSLSVGLPVMRDLEKGIEISIGPEGEVLDTASAELSRVRRELSNLRGGIQKKLTGLMRSKDIRDSLQDDIITRRGGRYVIPVRISSKGDVPGLVHDYSSSGATAYVEPFEMVQDNNRINYLRRKEKAEVQKVLARLSAMAAGLTDELAAACLILTKLDCLFAQASFSLRQKSVAPRLNASGALDIQEARHPLLVAQQAENGLKTVPIDIRLAPDKRILVISGINAGGKTVALKTLGLLMLMAQTGLHLPVGEGSTLIFFDRIMAVIGDEQDIQSDRSTFSGHIKRLNNLMEMVTGRSLVLLDELGTGTDPAEGAALALAVLDDFRQRGVWVMTATHYHLLKAWARLNQGADNASVRTDPTGRPAFGLDYGSPGFSAGLAMARGLGMDRDIVAKAESYLDEGQKKTIDLMQRLEEERAELAESRSRADFLVDELARAFKQGQAAEKARIEAQEKEITALRQEVNRSIKRFEDDFREIKRNLKDRADIGKVTADIGEAKKQLKKMVAEPVRTKQPLGQVKTGDRVLVWGLGKEGRVVSVDAVRRRVEVDISGMKIHAPWEDLASPQKGGKKKNQGRKISYSIVRNLPREINLLGYTVDEALPEVEKSLDQARVGGLKQFSIIHGIGTGRLRQAIRGYLQSDIRVKDFRSGDQRSGGEGVTMVELTD